MNTTCQEKKTNDNEVPSLETKSTPQYIEGKLDVDRELIRKKNLNLAHQIDVFDAIFETGRRPTVEFEKLVKSFIEATNNGDKNADKIVSDYFVGLQKKISVDVSACGNYKTTYNRKQNIVEYYNTMTKKIEYGYISHTRKSFEGNCSVFNIIFPEIVRCKDFSIFLYVSDCDWNYASRYDSEKARRIKSISLVEWKEANRVLNRFERINGKSKRFCPTPSDVTDEIITDELIERYSKSGKSQNPVHGITISIK